MDMTGRAGPVLVRSAHEPQLREHAGVLAAVSDAEQDALPASLPQSDRDRPGPPPPPASVAQQRLEQVHGAHVDALSQLVSQGADAHSLKHTGSALRARQQLGLAAAGDALTDESDHVVVAPPSQAEVDALERLGYDRSQAAFICMVDGLMRQGFSAEEAQTHLVKARREVVAIVLDPLVERLGQQQPVRPTDWLRAAAASGSAQGSCWRSQLVFERQGTHNCLSNKASTLYPRSSGGPALGSFHMRVSAKRDHSRPHQSARGTYRRSSSPSPSSQNG